MICRTATPGIICLTLLLAGCAGPAPTPHPGFEVVEHDRLGEIQVAEGVDWASYTAVLLAPATVEFRENWVRDQRQLHDTSIREQDEERIKSYLSETLDELLFRELTEKDYTVTTESVKGAALFRPSIVDLDIYSPDRAKDYMGFSMADSKGSMKMELEVFDPVSGKLLLTSWRNLVDPKDGALDLADSAGNQRAFYLMMQRWTKWMLDGLEKAGASPPN